jgi:hypothetical protein
VHAHFKLITVVAVLGLALVAVASASASADPHAVKVSAGYADDLHTSPGVLPDPWAGSPGVDFIGTDSPWDAGALKLYNPSKRTLTVDDVSVDFDFFGFVFATYDVWGPYPLTVPGKGTLILTQTDFFTFDTSEPGGFVTCDNIGILPIVHVTVGAKDPETKTFLDSGLILNTGGIDVNFCNGGNEGHDWAALEQLDED